jgi:hypothetical protein
LTSTQTCRIFDTCSRWAFLNNQSIIIMKPTLKKWKVVQGPHPSIKKVEGPSFGISAVMFAADLTREDSNKRKEDLDLIAAAPELLLELMAADAFFEQLGYMPDMPLRRHLRAVIAKAKGGAS